MLRRGMLPGVGRVAGAALAVLLSADLLAAQIRSAPTEPATVDVRSGQAVHRCVGCDSVQLADLRAALVAERARLRAEIMRLDREAAQTRDAAARRELFSQRDLLRQHDVRVQFELQEAAARARGIEGQRARFQFGSAPRGYVGLNLETSYERRSTPAGWVERYTDYPEVVSVEPGSPAERAGVRTGDVLLSINGMDAKEPGFTQQLQQSLRPGNQLVLRLRRGGGVHTLTTEVDARPSHFQRFTVVQAPRGEGVSVHVMTPGAPPARPASAAVPAVAPAPAPPAAGAPPVAVVAPAPMGRAVAYGRGAAPLAISSRAYPLAGADLLVTNIELARALGFERAGLLVLDVGAQTPASRSGLRTGDLIVRLAGTDEATIERLQEALRRVDGGRGIELEVLRDRQAMRIVLRW